MTKYREILRLTALGLSLRDIEKSLKVSRKTVVKVQKRADELSLSWPLDESLTDAELEQRMFPKDLSPKSTKRMPDFDYIRKELLKMVSTRSSFGQNTSKNAVRMVMML